MRIGIDARMYSTKFTGIGRYVYELTENLFKIDKQNEYVLFFNQPEYDTFVSPHPRIEKVLVNSPHYSVSEQTTFLKALYASKLDLMHFTHFNAPILYLKPSIVTIHDLTLSFYPGKKMNSSLHRTAYNFTLKSAVKKAKKVIAVSENTKKDLVDVTKIPESKIKVIYEGVNEEFFPIKDQDRAYKCALKYKIDRPYILYTGVWRSHKNLVRLIKAFHILKTEFGLNHYLVITGRPDPLYSEVQHEAAAMQLEDDIIFTGLVPEKDLVSLYCTSEAYVFPSLYEGFGLPVLEAMKCGTPVICSNTSCLPEIAGPENAVFFDPKSPVDIANKIYETVTNSQLKDQLIKKGFEHVKKFSWPKMAQETFDLYNEILKPKK